ncbi:MAG: 2-C-methyl-D-erythritol 4-phosphate cytidylyltransferase [Phycisphaerae bacterium]|nr:2-C-methyl-D-erythritol 4-phosphate cytidylyltransferase [Phycisphaerae bacterium]
MATVSVIIPAAGAGKRFGGKENKIFAKINDSPLFVKTLELFVNRQDVKQVILAVSADDMEQFKGKYGAHIALMGVKLIEGGKERCETVAKALQAVDEEVDLVAVHDAVRPCVSQLWIDDVFAKAAETGAAILACPLRGTLKRTGKGRRITETVSRSDLWEAQTPQVFARQLLIDAYGAIDQAPRPITDDAQVVEASGQAVTVVEGDPRNIKITTRGDLALAAALIRSLPKPKVSGPRGPFEEAQW